MISATNGKMFEYSFAIDPNNYDPKNFEPFFDEIISDECDENQKNTKNKTLLYPFTNVQSDLVRVCPHFDFISLNEHSVTDYSIEQIKELIHCSKLGFVDFSIKTPAKHWSGTAIAVAYHKSLCQPTWDLYRM